jgi:hypothetical protein
MPSRIEINCTTGESKDIGTQEVTEEQKYAAIEFLFYVVECEATKQTKGA